ncbi:DUF2277 family protein [Streptomyces sp. MS191]|uniref:DUF2277 family protein n=1 Tax=Streptomyces sp. ms191 TaxID=1827978 RepID=UPI0021C58239|nr:DUF2277 family protein [Streptomyces sp. ms191]
MPLASVYARRIARRATVLGATAAHNREVFDRAVEEIAEATARLLDGLEVRGVRKPRPEPQPDAV